MIPETDLHNRAKIPVDWLASVATDAPRTPASLPLRIGIERDAALGRPQTLGLPWLLAATLVLVLSAAYLVTGVQKNLLVTAPGYTNAIGNAVGTDFTAFYAAARLAREGRGRAIYDVDALHDAHEAVRGVDIGRPYAWAYPPTILLLLAPLSLLPLVPAMWAWLAGTTALVVLAAHRILPSPMMPLLVVLFPGIGISLFTGPTGTFSAAVATAGLVLLRSRALLAGLVLALLSLKPHLAILLPLCLLAGGERQALRGFVLTTVALALASVLAFGTGPWLALEEALPRHMAWIAAGDIPWMRMPTAFVAIGHATGSASWAWAAQAVVTAGVVTACVWVWRRSNDPLTRALALAASIPLVGPYAYDYDTSVLIAPLLYAASGTIGARAVRAAHARLLALLWLTPLALWVGSAVIGQQIGPILLGALLVEAVGRAHCSAAGS